MDVDMAQIGALGVCGMGWTVATFLYREVVALRKEIQARDMAQISALENRAIALEARLLEIQTSRAIKGTQ